MPNLPNSLEEATQQAIDAMFTAIDAGDRRILIDLRFGELKPLPLAKQLAIRMKERYGNQWQALFSDAGAAALAKRDWPDISDQEVSMRGVNEGRAAIREDDQAFLLIAPSSVEVDQVEKLLALAGDRPFIMFNPRLENSEVGIGLATRKMRERFLNTFTVCYYMQPLDAGLLWRCYPGLWQVYRQGNEVDSDKQSEQSEQSEQSQSVTTEPDDNQGGWQLINEDDHKPSFDELERIFLRATGKRQTTFLDRMQQFLSALNR
ncbi:protein of unknown function DUF1995-containing protein [Thalassoporum mexicanum PCC 7367]|uniref:DUF1995 family protein n=1 Tax=Thalassoporum mexicanum TaxID=3457544 RepID=UPI00029F99F7|nr:DUF1995 family protein [Pseudanabaena sp. PCC 7367]AFY70703.1 protein of unknown function DUF1995-containing protein [Pseudanabaena sp. PCC 7367]